MFDRSCQVATGNLVIDALTMAKTAVEETLESMDATKATVSSSSLESKSRKTAWMLIEFAPVLMVPFRSRCSRYQKVQLQHEEMTL